VRTSALSAAVSRSRSDGVAVCSSAPPSAFADNDGAGLVLVRGTMPLATSA
jgi:hypothetical protein